MIVIAKLSFFIIWLMAFMITCVVVGITFPFIVLADKSQMLFKEMSV